MTPTEIETLLAWLDIDSTSGRERAFLEHLEREFVSRGMRVTRQPVETDRWNLLAGLQAAPPLVFCTHVDTVPPFFGGRVDGERIRGRGACDTKGGLLAMLRAWEQLEPEERARVGFLLVVGEEVDHIGATVAEREGVPGARAFILCEPTQNRVARGQKGIVKARLCCEGRAGHSAFPEVGHSAVHDLIAVCHDLLGAAWPDDEVLGPTTLNVGVIEGGVAANVIAPSAAAELMFRVVGEADRVREQAEALLAGRARLESLTQNDAVRLLVPPGEATDVVPFNTDAPYLQTLAPVVLAGPGDIRTAHSPDEHLTTADFDAGVAMYVRLARALLAGM